MGFPDRRGAVLEHLAAAGGLDMAVRVVDYDPTWPASFEAQRKRLGAGVLWRSPPQRSALC
jgi:GrpB-like predicted nucleotidyltransferase (UPF0157 family)